MRKVFTYEQYLKYRQISLNNLSGGILKKGTPVMCIMPKWGDETHLGRGNVVSEDRFNACFARELNGVENIGQVYKTSRDYILGKSEVNVEIDKQTIGYYSHRFIVADAPTYEEFLGVQND